MANVQISTLKSVSFSLHILYLSAPLSIGANTKNGKKKTRQRRANNGFLQNGKFYSSSNLRANKSASSSNIAGADSPVAINLS